ncbi:MAG: hypothetical protein UHY90_07705 [Treponema sp.]|nr:hypothetical protein [Spirochaetia bacterium]MDD7458801.1 hypothetical protein [Spirochaetales bacterium]MDY5811934.1 hypothetical protein [Treponema sp.]MEE1182123.1 hypothetical protein [Treponema sp.]
MNKKSIGKIIWTVFISLVSLATVVTAVYIMVHGLGLVDSLDFGAGAYYYADIPEFQKYVDPDYYENKIPMIVYILIFLAWGAVMFKLWSLLEKKFNKKDANKKNSDNKTE